MFFVSDGTGITAETLGHSVLTQFGICVTGRSAFPLSTVQKRRAKLQCASTKPVSATASARSCSRRWSILRSRPRCARGREAFVLEMFETFVEPLERELESHSTHTIGRSHAIPVNSEDYKNRIEAINFTLAHDDGQSAKGLAGADVILVGVSRSGKTPTSLYLAMQYGVKAANYPLIPEDFERGQLPRTLPQYKDKIYGLSISPERLSEVRHERRPNSRYAALENCRSEVEAAERMMRREGIRWLSSTTKSIEEIAATIMQEVRLERRSY